MKTLLAIFLTAFFTAADSAFSYPVESADKCRDNLRETKKVNGIIGNVLMGEKPFLNIVIENGDEILMLPEDRKALDFFRENKGKKMGVLHYEAQVFWSDDFSGNGPGDCRTAYFFKSGEVIE